MEFDENELNIAEFEGVLIDTRSPNDGNCKLCRPGLENGIDRPECLQKRENKGRCGGQTVNGNRSNGAVKSNQRISEDLCDLHMKSLAFFCVTCEIPVCGECVSTTHKEHYVCKRFEVKSHRKQKNIDKVKGRHAAELLDALETALSGINQQHGIAKLQVINQFDTQKRALEKWKESSLQELEDWRREQESQLTEIHGILNELDEHSADTCELIINSLRCGNALESLSLKNVVKIQLSQIINKREPTQECSQNGETGSVSGFANVEEASSLASNTSRSFLKPTTSSNSELQLSSPAEMLSVRQGEALLVEKARQLEEAPKVAAREFEKQAREFKENDRKSEEKMRKREEKTRKLAEEVRKADEARKLAEDALAEEILKAEKARKFAKEAKEVAEEILKDEKARKFAEEARKADEARKLADEALAEEIRKAEEAREADEARNAELVSNRSQDSNGQVLGSRYSLNLRNLPNLSSGLPDNRIPRIPMDLLLESGRYGFKRGQFDCPSSFCVGWKENIYVADSGNDRIQVIDTNGYFKFEFGGDDLSFPYKIAAFKDTGDLVVVDWGDDDYSRINLYKKTGKFIREIRLRPPLGRVTGLAVTDAADIVIIHEDSAEILVINDKGTFTSFPYGKCIVSPSDIDVWGGEFFVTDLRGHAVVVFGQDGLFKRRFESKLKGEWYPGGISVTGDGTVLVAYSFKQQFNVVGYNRVGQDLFFSRGPSCWVSTCCGLRLTSDGKLVTVSKKENFILITKLVFER